MNSFVTFAASSWPYGAPLIPVDPPICFPFEHAWRRRGRHEVCRKCNQVRSRGVDVSQRRTVP